MRPFRSSARAALATLLLLAPLAGCGSDDPDVQSAPSPAASATSAPAAPSPTAGPTAGSASARAVYWLGSAADPRGPPIIGGGPPVSPGGDPIPGAPPAPVPLSRRMRMTK